MAVEVVIAVPAKGNLTFDFTNEVITVANTIDALTAQELADAIRDAEDELLAETFDPIAVMAGKTDLGSSVYTGIVIELLGWKIVSAKTSGTFVLQDGTIIGTGVGGQVFDTNNLVTQINLMTQSASIVTSGSGVTAQDKTDIKNLIFAEEIENSETFKEQMKLIRAEAAGKLGISGSTITFRDAADSKDRITATTDSNGQRTAVTVDAT